MVGRILPWSNVKKDVLKNLAANAATALLLVQNISAIMPNLEKVLVRCVQG